MPESTPQLHSSRGTRWTHALPPGYTHPGPWTRTPALCGRFVDVFVVREQVQGGGFAAVVELHRRWFTNYRSYAPRRPKGNPDARRLRRRARRSPVPVCPACRKAFRELTHPRWRPLSATRQR